MIELPDVEEAVLRPLLEYMYCEDDKVLSDPDVMCHVLKVAHRFEVSDLVAMCTSRLEVTWATQLN